MGVSIRPSDFVDNAENVWRPNCKATGKVAKKTVRVTYRKAKTITGKRISEKVLTNVG